MSHRVTAVSAGLVFALSGCSGSGSGHDTDEGSGGSEAASGGQNTGGAQNVAGTSGNASGATATGGMTGRGGAPATNTGSGGTVGSAGRASGGAPTTGGTGPSTGGTSQGNGGGTSQGNGGGTSQGNGGGTSQGNGGASAGGTSQGNGGSATGGTSGAGGNAAACKRGIAANTAPSAAFFPAIGWRYNWSMNAAGANVGIEFTPMMWGKGDINTAVPSGSKFLLTFNEPNFHAQSNLTAQQAADAWPTVEKAAEAAHVPIVSPAVNFCGPADQCNDGTSPYQYLKDFFAACTNCEVDYVAVHWYNCDLPSLKDYLEPGGNLEGFEQFGKPIWLTEFSCNGDASEADNEKYMRAAIPYLEGNAHVYRYSWFSAGPIPNAELMNADGSPTALGKVYIGLDGACK